MRKASLWVTKWVKNKKAVFIIQLFFCLIVACFFVFLPENYFVEHDYQLCWWRRLTGLPCLGCGSMRATSALFHGDLRSAWHYNPLIFLWLVLIIGLQIYLITGIMRDHARKNHCQGKRSKTTDILS